MATNNAITLPKPWTTTPLMHSPALSHIAGSNIHLKLENLQPSGSFKSRGIGNLLLQYLQKAFNSNIPNGSNLQKTHFYSSSGGNAGLAAVTAARSLNASATVIVPESTSPYMIEKIRTAGAEAVIQCGKSWAEADAYLREVVLVEAEKRGEKGVYVHPFEGEEIWEGHSSMIPEIKGQLAGEGKPDLVVCSVGGGGLLNGICHGLEREGWGDVLVLGVETKGAESFSKAIEAGELVTLDGISSIATSLGARGVSQRSLDWVKERKGGVKSLVLEDRDAVEGCAVLAESHRVLVEPACGVCVTACEKEKLRALFPQLTEESNVVIVVCGGSNVTIESLDKYKRQYL